MTYELSCAAELKGLANKGFLIHNVTDSLQGDAATMLLIVEDNETLLFYLRTLMQRHHWKGLFADNSDDAIFLYNQNQKDVSMVFMDLSLPGGLDGLSCAAAIRAKNPNIPIVAITAHASKEHRAQCINAGMNDYLSKPFTTEEFTTMVRRWQTPQQVSA